ncbi:type II toxin-antitoxin system VapC family toxin [Sphingobium phenoxybenzoativorans]|uniref:Type II toxin-antitoxin system VapC family toxin n=1 Tax=Sphingobium phenoxybenzoativorans TaxID=1592790 RepID=A0A975Q230_9SPHN|nr:type II toxin-antitoxin system VapC family toxin [Sphingobium phenoxybenzoativorans]QUT06251.1 type II toxin-antitoxin system VapC family toxin [Sphingobium phenoxybenzoativorans]
MQGIDTNIVVRLLTADDPGQAQAARHAVEDNDIFLGLTVLLEAEWVLRAGYGFEPAEIARAFRGLAGLPNVTLEEPPQVAAAIEWMEGGMDFADALHLARSGHCEKFLTFDRKFAKRAGKLAAIPVIAL